jgi:hypothetical protein
MGCGQGLWLVGEGGGVLRAGRVWTWDAWGEPNHGSSPTHPRRGAVGACKGGRRQRGHAYHCQRKAQECFAGHLGEGFGDEGC